MNPSSHRGEPAAGLGLRHRPRQPPADPAPGHQHRDCRHRQGRGRPVL